MSENKRTRPTFDIRSFRLENGLTQSEMAVFLGVTQKTISRWELGVDQPGPDVQARLQTLLGGKGENHWLSVYDAIRQAAVPIALVDDRGNVLVASDLYPPDQSAPVTKPAMIFADAAPLPPMQTILVIEDDRAILKATGAVLKRWQFLTVGAADGEEALRMVRDGTVRPDAAIIDFLLPGSVDGVDIAVALRQIIPDLPVLMISGEATPPRMRKISASGLPLIQKPVDPRQLRAALLSLLPRAVEPG